jgi:hypothetical protein
VIQNMAIREKPAGAAAAEPRGMFEAILMDIRIAIAAMNWIAGRL